MEAKDRCTVAACCNTTGSLMVPLAVISTAKTPMVFRHVRKPRCPYYAQSSAWLDSSICQRWFDEVFVPFIKNTTSHKVALVGQLPRPHHQERGPADRHHLPAPQRHIRLPGYRHGDPVRSQVPVQDRDGGETGGSHPGLGLSACAQNPTVRNYVVVATALRWILFDASKIFCKYHTAVRACACLLYTSPSPRDLSTSRMPSSA